MKNKWKGLLSKEIPLSVLKKTLALLLAVLMVVTSGDFSGLYSDGVVRAEESNPNQISANFTVSDTDNQNKLQNVPFTEFADHVNDKDVLGNAWNYGITANTWQKDNHAETNFAVKKLINNSSSTGMTEKSEGSDSAECLVGIVQGDNGLDLSGKTPLTITVPEEEQAKLHQTGGVPIKFINDTYDNISQKIQKMLDYVSRKGAELLKKDSIENYTQIEGGQNKPILDFTSDDTLKPKSSDETKTIYINVDQWIISDDGKGSQTTLADCLSQNGFVTIKKYWNQVLVFNLHNENITLNKIKVTNVASDGTVEQPMDSSNLANVSTSKIDIASTLIFNMPNAKNVTLNDSCGIFMAPSAIVTCTGVDGGWLVANEAITQAEWHFINGKLPDTFSDGSIQFKAKKYVNGGDPGNKQFSFSLKKLNNGQWQNIQPPVQNSGTEIEFNPIKYTYNDVKGKQNIVDYYLISEEDQTVDGILYHPEHSVYYAKVTVKPYTSDNNNNTKNYGVVTDVQYFEDQECKKPYSESIPKFNNKSVQTSISFTGNKTLVGRDLKEGEFSFSLKETKEDYKTQIDTFKPMEAKNTAGVNQPNIGSVGSFTFNEITYTSAGEHYYVISENIPEGAVQGEDGTYTKNGITYDGHEVRVHVKVQDDGPGKLKTIPTYYDKDGNELTGEQSIAFTNTYNATGSIQFKGTKTLV
ncbi:MAG: FctA domain-containing protein, partial [Lachnospiraceae bacterium]|nr:FctA domain-containing protein [Lachnospiraceae bacterium]